MTFADKVLVSTGNLWRMKLRAFLTISGVVIAIAAFVSMLSFGAGNQQLITERFERLGLFSTMQVYPQTEDNHGDSVGAAELNDLAVEKIAAVPGVNLAYPLEAFSVTVTLGDSQIVTKAQALPGSALQTKIFSQVVAGSVYSDDSAREALVSEDFLELTGVESADSLIGQRLIVSMEAASIDSGLSRVIESIGERVGQRAKMFDIDSLRSRDYWRRTAQEELGAAMGRFVDGYLNNRALISDTLTVRGVLKGKQERGRRLRTEPVIIPVSTALRFNSAGIGGDPTSLLAAISSGALFTPDGDTTGKSYPQVTLDLDASVPYQSIKDSVEAMGFRTFSFAEQFDEIRRFFFYFDMALGLVGLIALVTASLGIVNTMVMSIVERRREIGVLKSLGADERDIRLLFLFESAVIGTTGAVVGIAFGWFITRVASGIAKAVMRSEGIEVVELFALPLWLILVALGFGLIVSILAGFYPASRAARVDPVEALRNE